MQESIARTQADSLRQWARLWQNEAVIGDGKTEVADRLFRAAAMIDTVMSGEVVFDPTPRTPVEAEPVVDEVREG